ncbi:MAG: YfaZ family outer membrane protein [Campylobacterota bacterium]|nr:YfaZ family outer membrane protein [Campylobacterota bacterium]
MLKKLGLVALSAVSALAMHTGEININNEDIEVAVKFDMGQYNSELDVDSTFVGLRYISAENRHDSDGLIELSYLMKKPLEAQRDFSVGIGFKLDYSSVGSNDFLALPLGLEAGYKLPLDSSIVPIYVGAQFYYAPSVLSFQDSHNYVEFKVNADIEVIERGLVTVGYRHIDTNYEAADVEFNSAAFIGFKFVF